MKAIHQILTSVVAGTLLLGTYSCQQAGGEQTGSEFIPDMAHSVAYEANVLTNYSLNSWDEESIKSRRELSQPRHPVSGTIPRGYTGAASHSGIFASANDAVVYTAEAMKSKGGIAYTPNGHVPYYYPDTEDGRNLATSQIKYNPFPISKDGIARGQELYVIYCGICHGDKADGNGYLVRDNGGKYPAQPANLVDSLFTASSNGRFYHAIMYGKNAMGGYADKLSFEERWQVIHYIRSLQAAAKKATYNDLANTLNPDYGVPEKKVVFPTVAPAEPVITAPVEEHTENAHGETGHSKTEGH